MVDRVGPLCSAKYVECHASTLRRFERISGENTLFAEAVDLGAPS